MVCLHDSRRNGIQQYGRAGNDLCGSGTNIVSTEYPVSLPAVVKLLEEDDDFISELALQQGLSNVIADNIRANHEAGIVFRRLLERLEEIIENIYVT